MSGEILAAPAGWSPQQAIAEAYPAISRLYTAVLPELRAIEARLDREEAAGHDASSLRQLLGELRWRFEYTGDDTAARATLDRLRRLTRLPTLPRVEVPDADGSYAPLTEVWFLKLDASVDHWLAENAEGGPPPRLLDRINDPDRLDAYLTSLLVSRPSEDGIDRRKELNFATASLVRLILRRRPAGYPWDPQLAPVIRRFVDRWQDPATGFFGADYEIAGRRWRTADLSLTFHMARYFEGHIGHWPQLIDTLLAMRERRYPHGWLDREGLTSHNNYDVAVLFALGWPAMRPDQHRRVQVELDRLLDWCLGTAIGEDGAIVSRAASESWPESYYFAIGFLDTIGFFDPRKRFWTNRDFPAAAELRQRLEARVRQLHPGQPMARMALDRLRGL